MFPITNNNRKNKKNTLHIEEYINKTNTCMKETDESLKKTFSLLIDRDNKLEELEEKSSFLLNETRYFNKDLQIYNANLFWRIIHYINIFRTCNKNCW